MVNNRLLPTRIIDTNGNYVDIAYKDANLGFNRLAIDCVTDTQARQIQFLYDANNNVTGVTAPGFGGTSQNPVTQTLLQFDYQSRTLSYTFSGLTVENLPGQFSALRHIYFPATNTGHMFMYSAYGMIYAFSRRRQMSINPGTGVISDGIQSSSVTFNYPTSGSTVLTDAPGFTQRTATAVNSPTGVYNYSTSTDGGAQTMTFTVSRPDSSQLLLTRSTNGSSPANGRITQVEIKNGSGTSMAKTLFSYANDPGGSPQVQSLVSYDDASPTANQAKVDFDYDQYGSPTNKREYGFQVGGSWQVRRRTRFTYKTDPTYINLGLRSLVTLVELLDAMQDTNDANDVVISKSSYEYDNYTGPLGGLEDYGGTADPPGHLSGYGTGFTTRGNVTAITKWIDITAGTTIQHSAKIRHLRERHQGPGVLLSGAALHFHRGDKLWSGRERDEWRPERHTRDCFR